MATQLSEGVLQSSPSLHASINVHPKGHALARTQVIASFIMNLGQVLITSLYNMYGSSLIDQLLQQGCTPLRGLTCALPFLHMTIACKQTLLACAAKVYPYDSDDFHRVCLSMVAASPDSSVPSGNIILARTTERGDKTDQEHSLVLAIGGDSLLAISGLVSGAVQHRPIALDLLWKASVHIYTSSTMLLTIVACHAYCHAYCYAFARVMGGITQLAMLAKHLL